jgi:hypothetical protein
MFQILILNFHEDMSKIHFPQNIMYFTIVGKSKYFIYYSLSYILPINVEKENSIYSISIILLEIESNSTDFLQENYIFTLVIP